MIQAPYWFQRITSVWVVLIMASGAVLLTACTNLYPRAVMPSSLPSTATTGGPPTTMATSYTPNPQSPLSDPRVAATAYAQACPNVWRTPEPTLIHHCVALEMAGLEIVEQSRQTRIAALPTITPYPSPTWDETPSLLRPSASSTALIGPDDLGDSPGSRIFPLRSAIDLWHIGSISVTVDTGGSADMHTIWLISYPGGHIYRGLLFGASDDPILSQMNAWWQCPMPIGDLFMTNVTGMNGVVSFRSTTGTTGTLDMASGIWQFADRIVTTPSTTRAKQEATIPSAQTVTPTK